MNIFQNRKLPKRIIIVLIAVVAVITVALMIINRNAPTSDKANLSELYGYEEGSAAVIVNGNLTGVRALMKNGHPYIRLGLVTDEINTRFYYEASSNRLLYTTDSQVISASAGQTYDGDVFFTDTREEGSEATYDEGLYVLLSYVQQYTDIQVDVYQNPARIFIRSRFGDCLTGTAASGASIRTAASNRSPVITGLSEGDEVWVIAPAEEGEGWYRVYAGDSYGFSGYIREDELSEIEEVTAKAPGNTPDYSHFLYDNDICLVWHQTLSNSGIKSIEGLLEKTDGMNVLVPTWFSIDDSEGNVISRADSDYVAIAKSHGLHLWALVENFNTSNKLDYSQIFGVESIRQKIINTLVNESIRYGIEGINVDFEGLPVSAGDGYLQFMRELSISCRKNGLLLSVDCYVPSAWTQHYHRDRLAEIVDYLIIMAYDEHYEGSDAGSTSSLSFVQSGIEDTIKEGVPVERIIPAIPFYSRLWKGEGVTLTSGTISMDDMKSMVNEYKDGGGALLWDEVASQYYLERSIDGTLNRLWVEDGRSLTEKLDVISEFDVAGIAGWKLGMENHEAWDAIKAYFAK